ncbi:hypothetical protein Patl1_05699 [Pistacia atlantica]|uniref:Uncharacterized protein n=1 Tax=Pistacia atlantica TaxID=434234 RepID=A0ACC1BTD1_9ROSI|nr:hypothetical protein Patl1_05699 [Pistacia atlantica]
MDITAIPLQFTDHGIEGVVPLELLPPHVRSKYQAKPNDRSKRAKKEDMKGAPHQVEENQTTLVPKLAQTKLCLCDTVAVATPASENDGDVIRGDLEASAAPMDTDATVATGNISQGGTPTPEEQQKLSDTDIGQEAGQLDADAEADAGMIDAEVDLDAVG